MIVVAIAVGVFAMKVIFFILMHKNPQQTLRLIQRLESSDSMFVVHVDRRAQRAIYHPIEELATNCDRVYTAKRVPCYWGGFGIVAATLECVRTALRLNATFDYALLLSGQDYPIKPLRSIFAFLTAQPGKQFIETFRLDRPNRWSTHTDAGEAMNRISWYTLAVRSRRIHIPVRRQFPSGLTPYGGSQWWCLSRECLAYIDEYLSRNPQILRFFRNVYIPDESFFQTIISNSRFEHDVVSDDLHYSDWTTPPYPWPRILDASDFDSLRSSDKLFARKFDIARDESILDLVDREILFADK